MSMEADSDPLLFSIRVRDSLTLRTVGSCKNMSIISLVSSIRFLLLEGSGIGVEVVGGARVEVVHRGVVVQGVVVQGVVEVVVQGVVVSSL